MTVEKLFFGFEYREGHVATFLAGFNELRVAHKQTSSKQMGTSALQPQELKFAKNLKELKSEFILNGFRQNLSTMNTLISGWKVAEWRIMPC